MSRRKTVGISKTVEDTWEVIKPQSVQFSKDLTSEELVSDEWFESLRTMPREAMLQQVKQLQKKCQLYIAESQRLLIRSNKADDRVEDLEKALKDSQESRDKISATHDQQAEEIITYRRNEWALKEDLRSTRAQLLEAKPIIEESDPLGQFSDLLDLSKRKTWTESDHIVVRAITQVVIVEAAAQIDYRKFATELETETLLEHPIYKRHIYPILKKILRTPVSQGQFVQGVRLRSEDPAVLEAIRKLTLSQEV